MSSNVLSTGQFALLFIQIELDNIKLPVLPLIFNPENWFNTYPRKIRG